MEQDQPTGPSFIDHQSEPRSREACCGRAIGVTVLCCIILAVLTLFYEFLLKDDDVANLHYGGKHDNIMFEPIQRCPQSPPMPLYLKGVSAVLKVAVLDLLFPPAFDAQKDVPWYKQYFELCLIASQLALPIITAALTIYRFATKTGPFDSYFAQYNCFGLMWFEGPWLFNALALWVSEMALSTQLKAMGDDGSHVDDAYSLVAADKESHGPSEPVGQGNTNMTALQLTRYKAWAAKKLYQLTSSVFWLGAFPFFVTHVIPGAVLFLPVSLLLFGGAFYSIVPIIFMTAFSGFVETGDGNRDQEIITANHERDARHMKTSLTPGIVLLNLALITAVVQISYYYEGLGWWISLRATWEERQIVFYLLYFKDQILSNAQSLTSLINECFL